MLSMSISPKDIVSFTQARTRLSDLLDEVKNGAEKVITKNGESYAAIIDSDRLDYYHRLERERIHLLMIDDIEKGLDDVLAGRTEDARSFIAGVKRHRKSSQST